MSRRSAVSWLAALPVILLTLLLIGPQQVGGPIAIVSTFGTSMEPTYEADELVVVAPSPDYGVGDVVAYRSDRLDAVVLHRIIDEDEDGYVTRGDNNDWTDPDRPRRQEILGTPRLRFPWAGRLLDAPVPARAGAVAAPGALLLLGGSRRGRNRREDRRSRGASAGRADRRPDRGDPASWGGWPRGVAAVGVVILSVAAVLLLITSLRPSTRPGELTYNHEGTFDYTTPAPSGLVYPEGEVPTGDPVFLRLVDVLDLSYVHELETPGGAERHLETSGRLWLEVSDGSGWSHRRPIGDEQHASDGSLELGDQLDITAVREIIAEIREEAGVSGGSERVEITADIVVEGELEGTAIEDALSPGLAFDLSEHRLSPRADGEDDDTVGAFTEEHSVTVDGAEPARLELVGRGLDASQGRVLGVALLGLGLSTLLVSLLAARHHGRLDEPSRLRMQYGSRLVEVSSVQPPANHGSVLVGDMATLARLADLAERPILHHVDGGVHTYVVEDETTQYRYRIADDAPAAGAAGDAVSDDDGPCDSAESVDGLAPDSAESPSTHPPEPSSTAVRADRSPSSELDIDGLERLFDRQEPSEEGPDDEAPPSRPHARVSDDFFAAGPWSARR